MVTQNILIPKTQYLNKFFIFNQPKFKFVTNVDKLSKIFNTQLFRAEVLSKTFTIINKIKEFTF